MKVTFTHLFHKLLVVGLFLLPFAHKAQWTVLNSNYTNLTLDDIYASSSGDTIIAVGTDIANGFTGHTLYSFDGGSSWDTTTYNSGYFFKGIAFANNNIGVIAVLGSVGCVLRTTDGGVNWAWTWCDQTYSGVYDITFTDATTGYMAGYGNTQFGDGNIIKTTDAGQSWNSITGAIPNKPFEFIHFADNDVAYGGSFLFGHNKLYRSIDGGISWDSLDVKNYGSNGVYFTNAAHGFLAGYNGIIYETMDSANTWTKIGPAFSSMVFQDITFVNQQTGFIVGGNGAILRTDDGGQTWVSDNTGITNTDFQRVRAYNNRAYAVSSNGVIAVSAAVPSIGREEQPAINNHIAIFPNPFTQSAVIKIPESFEAPYKLSFTNIAGQNIEIDYSEFIPGQVKIERKQNPAGLYFYQLTAANGKTANGRFTIK